MAALAALPLLALVLAGYALRPAGPTVGAVRLTVIRAAVAVGAVAVLAIEALSLVDGIRARNVALVWAVLVPAAAGGALARYQRDVRHGKTARHSPARLARGMAGRCRETWRRCTRSERLVGAGIGGLWLAELVLAVASSPNNYDSNYYHLSKVEHWVANRDVDVYPTLQLPQVVLVPGAEFLLLHLRLLSGGDALHNLVQWCAGVGAALATSRIAAQLGAGRFGQLLTATFVVTTPMVVLQSTSTQTDLAAAAWLACAASLALDGSRGPAVVLTLGAAAGLAAATKSTTLVALAAVLALWSVVGLSRKSFVGTAMSALSVLALMLLLTGPHMLRMQQVFGGPLGPSEHRQGLAMQRHDPGAIAVNALRIGASTMVVPVPAVNAAVAGAVMSFARAIGVDPQDEAITLIPGSYPNPRFRPDEDHAPFPLHAALALVAVIGALGWRRVPARVRGYAGAVVVSMLLTAASVKWQTWGNRLVLPVLVLSTPLVGWWLSRLARPTRWRRGAHGLLALVVFAAFLGASASVLLGQPRRLAGANSVFVLDDWQERFVRQPQRAASYRAAATRVRDSDARRVGVVLTGDQWEYPWWLLLPDRELISLQSLVATRPAPVTSVDAILCAAREWECRPYVPPGWSYWQIDDLTSVAVRL